MKIPWSLVLLVELWFFGPAIAAGLVMGTLQLFEQPWLLITPLLLVLGLASDSFRRYAEVHGDMERLRECLKEHQNSPFPSSVALPEEK